MAERIPVRDLKMHLDTGENLIVVDVRDASEIQESGAIPGAIHIPLAQVQKRLSELPKDARIVFY
jgi:rhodanese-related sulfurtransferase